jgi:hypothetical protein
MLRTWRKSSRSVANGACVEVAIDERTGIVLMRDSKDPTGPVLTYGGDSWSSFIEAVKAGRVSRRS